MSENSKWSILKKTAESIVSQEKKARPTIQGIAALAGKHGVAFLAAGMLNANAPAVWDDDGLRQGELVATEFKDKKRSINYASLTMEERFAQAEARQIVKTEILSTYRDPTLQMYTIKLKNGDKYFGCCKGRVPNGFGKRMYKNGDWYEGDWSAGMRHGCGVSFTKATNTTYDGEWRKNTRSGVGCESRTNLGNTIRYIGRWQDDMKNGEGRLEWTNGRILKAIWKDDELIKVIHDNCAEELMRGCIDSFKASQPEYALMNLTTADFDSDNEEEDQ